MTEQTKSALTSHQQYVRDTSWFPLKSWWQQPSQLSHQEFGMPPFLEPAGDLWLEALQRRVAASAWPGYLSSPLSLPSVQGSMRHPWPRLTRAEAAGLSEVRTEQYKWKVTLDVLQFAPTDLTLKTRDGFLEIGGKHEERRDDHGFIARCFTRKYKLPIGVDPTKIQSTLSGDGFLFVEALLPEPEPSTSTDIIIPIQVEKEAMRTEGEEEREEEEDGSVRLEEAGTESRHPPPSAPVAPETHDSVSDEPATTEAPEFGESSLEAPGADEALPSSSTAGGQEQIEEKEEEKETPVVPNKETLPSGSAGDEGRVQESPEQAHPELHTEELQTPGSTGEASQDLPQPEEPEPGMAPSEEGISQELEFPEAPDIEQQDTTK